MNLNGTQGEDSTAETMAALQLLSSGSQHASGIQSGASSSTEQEGSPIAQGQLNAEDASSEGSPRKLAEVAISESTADANLSTALSSARQSSNSIVSPLVVSNESPDSATSHEKFTVGDASPGPSSIVPESDTTSAGSAKSQSESEPSPSPASLPIRTMVFMISDTHNYPLPEPQEKFDMALFLGDHTDSSTVQEFEDFINETKKIKADHKFIIAGNHEYSLDPRFDQDPERSRAAGLRHPRERGSREKKNFLTKDDVLALCSRNGLEFLDTGIHIKDLKNGARCEIYADAHIPYRSRSYPGFMYKNEVGHIFDIPATVDVVMTHGPPLGILDDHGTKTRFSGCAQLRGSVAAARPLLHCFGHNHAGFGICRAAWYGTELERPLLAATNKTKKSRGMDASKATRRDVKAVQRLEDSLETDAQEAKLTNLLHTSHCAGDDMPVVKGQHTLFVNAAYPSHFSEAKAPNKNAKADEMYDGWGPQTEQPDQGTRTRDTQGVGIAVTIELRRAPPRFEVEQCLDTKRHDDMTRSKQQKVKSEFSGDSQTERCRFPQSGALNTGQRATQGPVPPTGTGSLSNRASSSRTTIAPRSISDGPSAAPAIFNQALPSQNEASPTLGVQTVLANSNAGRWRGSPPGAYRVAGKELAAGQRTVTGSVTPTRDSIANTGTLLLVTGQDGAASPSPSEWRPGSANAYRPPHTRASTTQVHEAATGPETRAFSRPHSEVPPIQSAADGAHWPSTPHVGNGNAGTWGGSKQGQGSREDHRK